MVGIIIFIVGAIQKQSTSLNKRQSLTELRVICTMAGQRVEGRGATNQTQTQSPKVEIPNIEILPYVVTFYSDVTTTNVLAWWFSSL